MCTVNELCKRTVTRAADSVLVIFTVILKILFVPAALTMMDTLLSLIADIPLQLCPASVVSGARGMAGLFSS